MIQFFLTVILTFLTIFMSLFFLSKRRLVVCFIIMTGLCFFVLLMYFFENFILFYLCSKYIYEGFFEFLLVILWLMFIGISFAGGRDDYRDKEQFDPEGEVDSTPENTFDKVIERYPWYFEDDYLESMDWPGYEDEYLKSFSPHEHSNDFKNK